MPVIKSSVNARSEDFRANRAAMTALVEDLREKAEAVRLGGGAASAERHKARGKLLARERIDLLLDPGAPFLEVGQLAAHGLYNGEAPSAGVVAGVGKISGVECMIVANDATVKGGTYYPLTVRNTCARRRSQSRIICPVSIWSIPAAPSCRCRTRCFQIATTLDASSSTRPTCPPRAFRRSRR